MIHHLLAVLLSFNAHQAPTQPVHPYIRFEAGYNRLLDKYGHGTYTQEQRKRLVRDVWKGCGKDYETASYCACVGALESNYDAPKPRNYSWYKGRNYENARGYFGGNNYVLLAEVKRLKVGGRRAMWLAYWKRDPLAATYYSATRFSFITGIYGLDVGLRQWVTGDGWRKRTKDRKRAERYVRNCTWLRNKFF